MVDKESEGKVVDDFWIIQVVIGVFIGIIVVGVLGGYIFLQKFKYWWLFNRDDWLIFIEDIVFYYDNKNNFLN